MKTNDEIIHTIKLTEDQYWTLFMYLSFCQHHHKAGRGALLLLCDIIDQQRQPELFDMGIARET